MSILDNVAHIAAILTSVIAVFGYGKYRFDGVNKRLKLESYLKAEKDNASAGNKGQRSILHLMAKLGMTESEILQASFNSKRIYRRIAANPVNNRAEALLLEYRA